MSFAPYEDPRMDAAHSEGSYARQFNPRSRPPEHYTEIEKWAWDLGFRLQESLQKPSDEHEVSREGIPGPGT